MVTLKLSGTGLVKRTQVNQIKAQSPAASPSAESSRATPPPAEILSGDYLSLYRLDSKAKPPATQIMLPTFISFTDQFFRSLTSEDMRFLIAHTESKSIDKNPIFFVPQAGVHYLDQWNVSKSTSYYNQGSGSSHHQHLPSSYDGITGTFKQIDDVFPDR